MIQQVKRNLKRFPEDFMLQLTKSEAEALRSQIATSNDGRGGRRYAPYVFTAIAVNIEINAGWASTTSNWSRSSMPSVS